jgi:hypothetical protein
MLTEVRDKTIFCLSNDHKECKIRLDLNPHKVCGCECHEDSLRK